MVVLLRTVSIICSLSPTVFARLAHRRDGAERRSKTQVMPRHRKFDQISMSTFDQIFAMATKMAAPLRPTLRHAGVHNMRCPTTGTRR
jgi:hypothetical protein